MAGMGLVQKRFEELAEIADAIQKSKGWRDTPIDDSDPNWAPESGVQPGMYPEYCLDGKMMIQWTTSVVSLLTRVMGEDSPTTRRFSERANCGLISESPSTFDTLKAIFASAKNDFEGGFLFDVRNLAHAEVFSDELEQAAYFLSEAHKIPAAVIAGTVLESTLRELCNQHPTLASKDSANGMIGDLAKESVFNKMWADQLRAWMKIRNSAAHGKPDEFNEGDVTRMIDGIRDFVANHMS